MGYWKRTASDGPYTKYIAVNNCERCGIEYQNNNIFASKYCEECSKQVRKEKVRENMRAYRQRKKEKDLE